MGLYYENLDDITRQHMLSEWTLGNFYISPRLTNAGQDAWPELLQQAVASGSDDWLADQLLAHNYFRNMENYNRAGKILSRQINKQSSAIQLAEGEFNRLYVRALCVRAQLNGQSHLEVYRGKAVAQPRPESEQKIGTLVPVAQLLGRLRTNDFASVDAAFDVPAGPNSGLTCRLPANS